MKSPFLTLPKKYSLWLSLHPSTTQEVDHIFAFWSSSVFPGSRWGNGLRSSVFSRRQYFWLHFDCQKTHFCQLFLYREWHIFHFFKVIFFHHQKLEYVSSLHFQLRWALLLLLCGDGIVKRSIPLQKSRRLAIIMHCQLHFFSY